MLAPSTGKSHCFIPVSYTHLEAIRKILAAGLTITNQLVYNVAASRRGHTAKLRKLLNGLGVLCYYTFSVKGFEENYAVFTPNSRSLQEKEEEKRWGDVYKRQYDRCTKVLAHLHSAECHTSLPGYPP